jgi:hypothetical protein
MAEPRSEPHADAPLNPALQRSVDQSHGTRFEGTDPMKTVSVQDAEEGRSWPWIWAVVAVICVLVTIFLLL